MRRFSGGLFLFGAFVLAGTSVVAAKYVSGQLGIFTITFLSLAFALAGLIPMCRNKLISTLKGMRAGDYLLIILQGMFGIFLFRMFLLNGLMYTTSGEAGILTGVTPAATSLMAWFLLKEPLKKTGTTGLILTVAGILLIQGVLQQGNILSGRHLAGNKYACYRCCIV